MALGGTRDRQGARARNSRRRRPRNRLPNRNAGPRLRRPRAHVDIYNEMAGLSAQTCTANSLSKTVPRNYCSSGYSNLDSSLRAAGLKRGRRGLVEVWRLPRVPPSSHGSRRISSVLRRFLSVSSAWCVWWYK